jgi:hypothetical protein
MCVILSAFFSLVGASSTRVHSNLTWKSVYKQYEAYTKKCNLAINKIVWKEWKLTPTCDFFQDNWRKESCLDDLYWFSIAMAARAVEPDYLCLDANGDVRENCSVEELALDYFTNIHHLSNLVHYSTEAKTHAKILVDSFPKKHEQMPAIFKGVVDKVKHYSEFELYEMEEKNERESEEYNFFIGGKELPLIQNVIKFDGRSESKTVHQKIGDTVQTIQNVFRLNRTTKMAPTEIAAGKKNIDPIQDAQKLGKNSESDIYENMYTKIGETAEKIRNFVTQVGRKDFKKYLLQAVVGKELQGMKSNLVHSEVIKFAYQDFCCEFKAIAIKSEINCNTV